jgi:hypothetical protein
MSQNYYVDVSRWPTVVASAVADVLLVASGAAGQALLGGGLPRLPPGLRFPADNWWNVDVSGSPADPNSARRVGGCCIRISAATSHRAACRRYGTPFAVIPKISPSGA